MMAFNDDQKMCTTTGEPVDKVRAEQTEKTGQHKAYIVLCEEERLKGFVRPYRDRYKHVGIRPVYPLIELTDEQKAMFGDEFAGFEAYPPDKAPSVGRYWTPLELISGCGSVTTMGRALSETYARDPTFYGATFCVFCDAHFPVAEFVWSKNDEAVGS